MDNWLVLFDGQARYLLEIYDSPVKVDVLKFTGREALSEPFRWTIDFTTPQNNLAPEDALMKHATLRMRSGKAVHGIITRLEWISTTADQSHYQVVLSSRLALLSRTRQCRIFQHQSVPEVVEQVLRRHGLEGADFDFRLERTYPARELITQWRETDLEFVQRILSEVGIFWRTETDEARGLEVVIFADSQLNYRFDVSLPYREPSGLYDGAEESVWDVYTLNQAVPVMVSARDYNYRTAGTPMDATVSVRSDAVTTGEHYRYAAPYREAGDDTDPEPETESGAFYARTRIASTKISFEEGYKEAVNKSPVPIKLISVSLFGFDLGATLARKFLDSLLKDICQKEGDKYTYQGIPVDIVFTGLFDCSRRTSASNNNGVDYFISAFGGPLKGISVFLGDKSIDQDTPLPKAVKKSLHLVAAHETRVWRSLYRTGNNPAHKEELYPGCAEDIGGGLKPDEQKPSAELCRVALHRMYREATMAGVPFPDFQSLDNTDTDVAAYFIIQDNVKNQSVLQWAEAYQSALPFTLLSTASQNRHLDSYIDWLGRQYYQYRTECMKYEKQRGDTLASAGASAGFAGITQEAKETARQYASELSVLQQNWGWLDDVKDTAIRMRNSMEQNPMDRRRDIVPNVYGPALWRAKRFLDYFHAAHLGKPQPFPIDAAPPEMYAWFVHDLQTVEKGAGISQDFFVIRSMEMPEA